MYEQDQKTILPGVFATIASGFDLTAKHLWLLVLPVILDLFFWLGPRLRFQTLIEQALATLPKDATVMDFTTQLAAMAPNTNLFTMLSVQIIGVPVLMVGLSPEKTPLTPQTIDLNNWLDWIGLFLIFTLIGLLLTTLYYSLIALAIKENSPASLPARSSRFLPWVFSNSLRLLGLALFFLALSFIIYLPLIIMGSLLFLINSVLGSLVLLIGPFLLIWIIIYLSLAPSGIILNGRPILRAAVESVKLVQTHLTTTLLFLLTLIIIGTLVDWLLILADSGTWLTIVNIVAHAFVSTALVAALFIFYKDRFVSQYSPNLVDGNKT